MAKVVSSSRIEGLDGLRAVLREFPVQMRGQILRDALTQASQPLKAAAKRNARRSVRSGALYASIDEKVKVTKGLRNVTGYALVGPTRDYFRFGGKKVKKGESRAGAEQPSRYAPQIEFGHAVRQPKKGSTIRKGRALMPGAGKMTFVPARPFLRPALLTSQSAVARALAEAVAAGIANVRRKNAKGKL